MDIDNTTITTTPQASNTVPLLNLNVNAAGGAAPYKRPAFQEPLTPRASMERPGLKPRRLQFSSSSSSSSSSGEEETKAPAADQQKQRRRAFLLKSAKCNACAPFSDSSSPAATGNVTLCVECTDKRTKSIASMFQNLCV